MASAVVQQLCQRSTPQLYQCTDHVAYHPLFIFSLTSYRPNFFGMFCTSIKWSNIQCSDGCMLGLNPKPEGFCPQIWCFLIFFQGSHEFSSLATLYKIVSTLYMMDFSLSPYLQRKKNKSFCYHPLVKFISSVNMSGSQYWTYIIRKVLIIREKLNRDI